MRRKVAVTRMQGASVLAPEGRGDTLLAFEQAPQVSPALLLALLTETPADGLHQLIGDDGDKEVAVGTLRGLVKDGAQAKLGFERAEHGLHIGEGAVGAPQRLLVPARRKDGGVRGSEVSPCGLPQDDLVQGQVRYGAAQAGVFGFEFLEAFDLTDLEAA